jgi:RimJ/RimL family protein N-acetyltransferase
MYENNALRLRQAREGDSKLLWEWANDPGVRAVSFGSEPIPWKRHVEWLRSRLDDPNCVMYIAIDSKGEPIGQVRYDIHEDEAVISISVDQRFRGRGYGSAAIQLASRDILQRPTIEVIHAYVKQDNEASVRAFAKAGFSEMGMAVVRGHQAIHLVLRKDKLT